MPRRLIYNCDEEKPEIALNLLKITSMSRHSKFKAVTNGRNQCCGNSTRFPDGKNDPYYISYQRTQIPEKSLVSPLVNWLF